jgi:hypothetical protein
MGLAYLQLGLQSIVPNTTLGMYPGITNMRDIASYLGSLTSQKLILVMLGRSRCCCLCLHPGL